MNNFEIRCFFYNFRIILNENHPVTDDRDGSDSVSEGRPGTLSVKLKQLKPFEIFYFYRISIV